MGSGSGTASSSYAGSVASSRTSVSQRPRAEHENNDGQAEDLLDKRSSLENGIFGVLFTLSKENDELHITNRWVVLKVLLDSWQLFTTVVSPDKQGWTIDPNGVAWQIIGVLNFTWLADLGYNAYLGVLYAMLALLAVNVAMCVWVAWCFKEHKFPVVWPIKALRLFSRVFFQAFDIACLNLLQLGISCRYTGPVKPHMHFDLFPEYKCSESPHVAHVFVSALCLALFVGIALLINMAEVEVNLLCKRPSALGHSGAEVSAFAIKVLITLVQVFFGWQTVAACLQLALSLAFAWQYLRWSPHLVSWVNYLKSGVAVALVWVCLALTLLEFQPGVKAEEEHSFARIMTIALLAGLAPSFVVGALISWYKIRNMTNTALRALEKAEPYVKLKDICQNIDDPRDVEVVARSCRVWKDLYTLDPEAIRKARKVIQAGVAMFPKSAYMVLLHANFMIDVLGVSQSGGRRIDDARKLDPSLLCRFIMFVRQQEATQNAASTVANGGGVGMDLLAYVEYQRKQRMVVRLHREALQAMCNFWKALDATRVSFMTLTKALSKIESSVSQAQAAYRAVLENYNKDPKLVRMYGKFLQNIKNDPWHAADYFAQADRLEDVKSGSDNGPVLPDGTPLGRMDEIASAVLVITATGEVQMANRHANLLFGYKRGMLEMKPLTTLLAPHYTRRVADKLAAVVNSPGLGAALEPPNAGQCLIEEMVVGMHYDRLAFPVKMSVQKSSGVGEDSTFIVMLDAAMPTPGFATIWVAGNGTVVACDPQFISFFGWKPSEVNGASLTAFINPHRVEGPRDLSSGALEDREAGLPHAQVAESASDMVKRFLSCAPAASADGKPTVGAPCFVTHKFDNEPVPCTLSIGEEGIAEKPVHEMKLKLLAPDPAQLLVVSRKGLVLHSSPELVRVLKDVERGRLRGGTSAPNGGGGGGGGAGGGGPGGGGAGGGDALSAALGGVQSGGEPLAGFTLQDFLPVPWKDMHMKLLKATTALTPPGRSPWTCRKSASPGPTLELRSASGKPLFMRVGVTTTDIAGELSHVVRLKRSTAEAALAERRLRLTLDEDGMVSSVSAGTPTQLFGIDHSKFVGRGFWEFIDWSVHQESGALPDTGPDMFVALVKRAVTQPGYSWRVRVSPPNAKGPVGGAGGGVREVLAAARTTMTKQAIMQMNVVMPSNDAKDPDALPALHVDLWSLGSVTGVLEVDSMGRIRSVLEENLRPAGLLFGQSSQALVGSMLGDWLEMPPGRSRPGDLLTLNGYKKSSLKTATQESSIKLGPVHTLSAAHVDGNPLAVDIQVVGKPGMGQIVHAILRFNVAPALPSGRAPPPARAPLTVAAAAGPRSLRSGVALPGAAAAAAAAGSASEAPFSSFAIRDRNTAPAAAKGASFALRPSAAAAASRATSPPVRPPSAAPVSTPSAASEQKPSGPSVVSRGNADGHRSSKESGEQEAGGVEAMFPPRPAGLPPPTPSDVVGSLGSGVPVPGVTLGRAAAASPGRSRLSDLVKAVEGQRLSGSGGLRGSTLGSGDKLRPTVVTPMSPGRPGSRKAAFTSEPAAPASPQELVVQQTAGITTATSPKEGKGGLDELLSPSMTAMLQVNQAAHDSADVQSAAGSDGSQGGKAKFGSGADRISKWVASEGAFYQNSITIHPKDEEEEEEEASRRSDDVDFVPDDVAPATGNKPGVNLRALLRAGNTGSQQQDAAAVAVSPDGKALVPTSPGAGSARHKEFAAPFPEEDAASEGGQSAMSAQSGSGEAEYKRGKRFRKLVKLMESSQTQKVERRFWIHALLTVTGLAIIHIICFVMTIITIQAEQYSMLRLSRAGESQRYMHKVMTDVRSLDIIARNKTAANIYTPDKASYFISEISTSADEITTRLKEILDTHHVASSGVVELYQFATRTVWDGYDGDGNDKYDTLTIAEFANRFYISAKMVQQSGASWVQHGVPIAQTIPGKFLIKSGPDLWKASRQILDELLYEAVNYAQLVDVLQIVFLIAEGLIISSLAAMYLAYLLRALAAQRYKLYGTFLVIPVGLTRALASQNTNLNLSDNEDDDSDDEEEERAGSVGSHDPDDDSGGGPAPATPKQKRRATLNLVDSTSQDGAGGMSMRIRSSSLAARSSNSAISAAGEEKAVPPGTPDGMPRRSGSMKAGRQRSGVFSEDSADAAGAAAGGRWSWVKSKVGQIFSRRSRAVAPLPRTSHDLGSVTAAKRKLKYDSYDTFWVLLPFIVWSALVISIYAVAVVKVKGVVQVVSIHSVANFMSARTLRAIFFAQELCAVEDPADLASHRSALANVSKVVRDAWYTLQLGDEAYRAAGNATERFPLVTSGLAYASDEITDLIYAAGFCHRVTEHLPCLGTDYRYYRVSMGSLDSIMLLFLLSINTLASNNSNIPPGMGDGYFDMIYNLGVLDLHDGMVKIQTAHYDIIINIFKNILVLHIILFLMFWVIFIGFFMLQLNPLLKRVNRERRRIAELMSQLPLELDVEKLVARALGNVKTKKPSAASAAAGGASTGAGNGGSGGGAGGGARIGRTTSAEDAAGKTSPEAGNTFSKWKAIIRMTSSQVKAQAADNNNRGRRLSQTGP